MSEVDRFAGLARRIRKNCHGEAGPDEYAEIRELFVSCMPGLPETMKIDTAIYFGGVYAPTESIDEIDDYIAKLQEFIHLAEQDYERTEETFSQDDWNYIRDCASDFALELDGDILTYIMRQVVARGMMGS